METSDIKSIPSNWQPITNPVDLAVLGKLGEEFAECAAAIFRCIIQGIDEVEPTTKKPNREWLTDELADVDAMLNHCIMHFKLDLAAVAVRSNKKYVYKKLWFDALRSSVP